MQVQIKTTDERGKTGGEINMSQLTLNPQITGYDPQNALSLARLSELAYENEATIYAQLTQSGFPEQHFFNNAGSGTQGFIAANEQNLVIVFRGTEMTKIKDLITDAKIKLIPGPFGQVHRGFEAALDSVWAEVLQKITEFQHNQQAIWIAGHSLGGALATLAASQLLAANKPFHQLCNFGCPRVGDAEFASNMNQLAQGRCFRVRNNNDIVTRIPVAGLFFYRYRHIEKLIYFDSDGNRRDGIGFWGLLKEHLSGHINAIGELGVDDLEDHKIENYLDVLQRDSV